MYNHLDIWKVILFWVIGLLPIYFLVEAFTFEANGPIAMQVRFLIVVLIPIIFILDIILFFFFYRKGKLNKF